MRIAIIGSTITGGRLGYKLARNGHDIIFSALDSWSGRLSTTVEMSDEFFEVRPMSDAAIEADILFIDLSPKHRDQFLDDHSTALYEKIVVDLSNDIGQANGLIETAARHPDIIYLKLYGQGKQELLDHLGDGWDQQFFICGDDDGAKRMIIRLLGQIGCEVEDAGDLSASQFMDQLEEFWHQVATQETSGAQNYSFRLIRHGEDSIRSRLFSLS